MERCKSRVYVEAGEAESVIVVPDRAGLLVLLVVVGVVLARPERVLRIAIRPFLRDPP
jgi:hypothetical protein